MAGFSPEKHFEKQLDYAWAWFEYHAGQRLTGFNFFLILAGASIVAYSNAVKDNAAALGVGVAGFGVVVAIAFFILDLRNEQLIAVGAANLESLEPTLELQIVGPDNAGRRRVANHTFVLRSILGTFALLGVAAAVWAYNDYGRDPPPRVPQAPAHR